MLSNMKYYSTFCVCDHLTMKMMKMKKKSMNDDDVSS